MVVGLVIQVNPSMGNISLDTGETYVISRANFKPAHKPPTYDFDNANYYFYTLRGGVWKIFFKGSGHIFFYVGPTDSKGNPIFEKQIGINNVAVNNTTFYFKIKPMNQIQPIVFAYNPSMGQNIQDNIEEIVISPSSEFEAKLPNTAIGATVGGGLTALTAYLATRRPEYALTGLIGALVGGAVAYSTTPIQTIG
jgi:hypothetical protein